MEKIVPFLGVLIEACVRANEFMFVSNVNAWTPFPQVYTKTVDVPYRT